LQIELALDLGRLCYVYARAMLAVLAGQFLVQDLLAKHNAVVANVNAWPGN